MSGTIIGSANGGRPHYWPGWRSEGILEAWVLPLDLSGKESAYGLEFLRDQSAEIRAGLIAYTIYEGFESEFGTHAHKIAGLNARDTASRFDWDVLSGDSKDQRKNWLVGYTEANEVSLGDFKS